MVPCFSDAKWNICDLSEKRVVSHSFFTAVCTSASSAAPEVARAGGSFRLLRCKLMVCSGNTRLARASLLEGSLACCSSPGVAVEGCGWCPLRSSYGESVLKILLPSRRTPPPQPPLLAVHVGSSLVCPAWLHDVDGLVSDLKDLSYDGVPSGVLFVIPSRGGGFDPCNRHRELLMNLNGSRLICCRLKPALCQILLIHKALLAN